MGGVLMNFQRLVYFLTLAKVKNFTRAAEELYISQPALSKQIALFEEELGVTLLKRSTKSVELTFAGEILADEGKSLVDLDQKILHHLKIAHGAESVPLHIGSATYWAEKALVVPFTEFSEKYPESVMDLQRMSYSSVLSNLDKDNIQLGIIKAFDYSEVSNYSYKELYMSKTAVVCTKDHHLAKLDVIPIKRLKNERIVMLNVHQGMRSVVNDTIQLFEKYGIRPKIHQEYDIIESMFFMVEIGRAHV